MPKTHSNPTEIYDSIKLGIDAHAKWFYVARQMDGATPQPVQKMDFEGLLHFVARQQQLAKEVYTCYEAGAFGYYLHRRLIAMGVTNYVIQPQDWDELGKGVKTDRIDASALCQRLDRYTRGNLKAFSIVRVPAEEEEQDRAFTRQRQQIVRERQRVQAMGRSLLAFHGIHVDGRWWKGKTWSIVRSEAPEWVIERLRVYIRLIEPMEAEEMAMTAAIQEAGREAEAKIPRGEGPLTFEGCAGRWATGGVSRTGARYRAIQAYVRGNTAAAASAGPAASTKEATHGCEPCWWKWSGACNAGSQNTTP